MKIDMRMSARSFSAHQLAKLIVIAILAIAMILAAPGGHPLLRAFAQGEPLQDEMAEIERLVELLTELRAEIDASKFDLDELSLQLAFESPDYIVRWMQEHIAFEQYEGLLRGPQGTLLSGAGNALDQAVLLARLLRDSGYDARIARGRLSWTEAKALVDSMTRTPRDDAVFRDDEKAASIIHEIAQLGEASAASVDPDLDPIASSPSAEAERALESARGLSSALETVIDPSSAVFRASETVEELYQEATDYYWVEFADIREGDGAWTDAHPVLRPGQSMTPPAVDQQFDESVPSELLHRLRLDIVIDRSRGSDTDSVPVASTWDAPVANLTGRSITFTNIPNSLLGDETPQDVIEVLDSATMFFPVLDGELAPGASAFNLQGLVAPADAAMNPASGVFENVARGFGDAIGALDGEDSAPSLIGQRLVFTFVRPDGTTDSVERTVSTRAHRAQSSSDEWSERAFRERFLSQYTFMVAGGAFPSGFVLNTNIRTYIEFLESLVDDLRSGKSRGQGSLVEIDSAWRGHHQLFAAFEAGTSRLTDLAYRHQPALVLHRLSFRVQASQTQKAIDIAASPRRAFVVTDQGVETAPRSAMQAGIWETWAEVAAFDERADVASAVEYLSRAHSNDREFLVIEPGEDDKLWSLALDEGSRENLRRDLARGFVVAIPADVSTETEDHVAWWRINPRTGQTTGVLGDGTGGALQDASLYLVLIGLVSFAILVYTMVQCDDQYIGQPAAWSVCFACAWLSALIAFVAVGIAIIEMSFMWALGAILADKVQVLGCIVLAELFAE